MKTTYTRMNYKKIKNIKSQIYFVAIETLPAQAKNVFFFLENLFKYVG